MVQTDRVGINAVEAVFLNGFDWLFREQSISDWGVDAHVEVKRDGQPTGRLLALQIKSGASYFKHEKDGHYVFYGKSRHLWYWQNNSLPVVLILHNPETGMTLWEKVDLWKVNFHKKGWSVKVSKFAILDKNAKQQLEHGVADASVERKLRLALDYPVIEMMGREAASFVDIYRDVQVEERPWIVRVHFDGFNTDAALTLFNTAGGMDIGKFMADQYPWLDFDYFSQHELVPGMAATLRTRLRVWVNELGRSYINLEKYYEQGAPETLVEDPGWEGEYAGEDPSFSPGESGSRVDSDSRA